MRACPPKGQAGALGVALASMGEGASEPAAAASRPVAVEATGPEEAAEGASQAVAVEAALQEAMGGALRETVESTAGVGRTAARVAAAEPRRGSATPAAWPA